ncbi:MAG: hypothetical protein E7506_05865 [Ruminococcus sp.]|nr:hypothetical protein [Ruminococcus sp.]
MKRFLSSIISLMILCTIIIIPDFKNISPLNTAHAFERQGEAEAMLSLINQQRERISLPPLKLLPLACEKANIRAVEISSAFSHSRPDGSSCFSIIENVGYSNAGENIAMNYSHSVESALSQWMNSEGHRNNILSKDYTHIGIGCYCKDGAYYWVQLFLGNSRGYDGEYTPIYNDGTPYSYGDIDGNGVVDAADASIALTNYAALATGEVVTYSIKERKACDVNCDGDINAGDASCILIYYSLASTGNYPYFNSK